VIFETGGTWCVRALGTGPEDVREYEQFPTTSPRETLGRILSFFRSHDSPAAIGIESFGPVDAHGDSATWGHVTSTPKPRCAGQARRRRAFATKSICPSRSTPT
jgi:fructokinase